MSLVETPATPIHRAPSWAMPTPWPKPLPSTTSTGTAARAAGIGSSAARRRAPARTRQRMPPSIAHALARRETLAPGVNLSKIEFLPREPAQIALAGNLGEVFGARRLPGDGA